jgi:outer membrane protein assembly factor BamA
VKLDEDWKARVGAAYRQVGVTKPTNGLSVQESFSSDAVPGLNGGTIGSALFTLSRDTTSHTDLRFQRPARDTVEVSYNRSPADGDFRYWRLHYDSIRFIPLNARSKKTDCCARVGRNKLTPNGKQVPFFDLPFLGANQTMRGFENFRFRDKSAVALTLEYR